MKLQVENHPSSTLLIRPKEAALVPTELVLTFLSLLLAVVLVDEAAGIIMGEEWMKDAAWLVEFPLHQKQWCIGQRHSSMLLSATAQRVSSYKDSFSSEAGIIGFAEDKNLRTRHYEADLEFHERFHCRFKCEHWWKGTLSGKYPKSTGMGFSRVTHSMP